MRVNRKVFFPLLILCIALLFLTSCNNTPATRSESDIQEDLISGGFFSLADTYDIQAVEITKRQTNVESNFDKVYATITALSNDGWLLEEASILDSSLEPLQGVEFTNEQLKEALEWYGFSQISDIEVYDYSENLAEGTVQYSLTAKSAHLYADDDLDLTATFYYDALWGWNTTCCSYVQTNSSQTTWHLIGQYGPIYFGTNPPADRMFPPRDGYYDPSEAYELETSDFSHIVATSFYDGFGGIADHITENAFKVELTGDYTSLDSFQYATRYPPYPLSRGPALLLIGKDDIAICWHDWVIDDTYNQRIVLKLAELKPDYVD